jgi:lysozyme
MDDAQKLALKNLIIKYEGLRLFPYQDTTGNCTIGYGRNLADRGISKSEAYILLNDDIDYFYESLCKNLSFFDKLDKVRQIVLLNMCFNLGIKGLLEFNKMLEYLSAKQYYHASQEMLDSIWAKQVGERAKELAEIMEDGVM